MWNDASDPGELHIESSFPALDGEGQGEGVKVTESSESRSGVAGGSESAHEGSSATGSRGSGFCCNIMGPRWKGSSGSSPPK